MAEEKKSGYCGECQEKRVVYRPGTNHILHLLLSLVTAGFWLIIWFCCSVKFGGWRCATCGSQKIRKIR